MVEMNVLDALNVVRVEETLGIAVIVTIVVVIVVVVIIIIIII